MVINDQDLMGKVVHVHRLARASLPQRRLRGQSATVRSRSLLRAVPDRQEHGSYVTVQIDAEYVRISAWPTESRVARRSFLFGTGRIDGCAEDSLRTGSRSLVPCRQSVPACQGSGGSR